MRSFGVLGAALAMVTAGCAHDSEGHWIRTPDVRFDARSISGPNLYYTLESDGTWAGMGGDRYARVGDAIERVGGFDQQPRLIRPGGSVDIERRPDGLVYEPSWPISYVWTFVTEDGKPIPRELEVPLYLVTQLGLTGALVNLHTPGSELAGVPLAADCSLVLFDLQGREVAGWVALKGAVCPEPRYPEKDALARLVTDRNEVWQTQLRSAP